MRNLLRSIRQFLSELRRRNVYRVAVTYVVVGFFVIEGADLVLTRLGLPPWTVTLVIVLVGVSFPIALVMAWALEVTPEGVRVEESEASGEEIPAPTSTTRDLWGGASVLVLLLLGAWWLFPLFYNGTPEGTSETPGAENTTATDTVRAASRNRPFVAVLPLENLSPDEENQFFADGIHEEILGQLSKVSGLGVKSRTSVLQYEDTEKTMEEIAQELGVQAILEGSVRRAADRVRITTQLIDGEGGDHLWSETYERALSPDAVFDIQADIAGQIAAALETKLTEGERKRIEEAPTSDLAAYDAYLRGRSQWFRNWETLDPLDLRRSIESLREAVRQDPSFAEAHAWLGLAYAHTALMASDDRWVDSASVAVNRARSLDPNLASVHLAQAFVHERRDSTTARTRALRRVLRLQPSHAFAKAELSDALERQGRYVEAVQVAHEAVQLDPRDPVVLQEMADQLRAVGLYEASEAWDCRALALEPGHLQPTTGLAETFRLRGDYDQELETWQRLFELQDRSPLSRPLMRAALAALRAGHGEQADAYLERMPEAKARRADLFSELGSQTEASGSGLQERYVRGLAELRVGNENRGRELLTELAQTFETRLQRAEGPSPWHRGLAQVRAILGQRERALYHLEQWVSEADRVEYGLSTDPLLADLRSEPRFQEIVQEVEAKQKQYKRKILQMGLDLYPPEAAPDTERSSPQIDE